MPALARRTRSKQHKLKIMQQSSTFISPQCSYVEILIAVPPLTGGIATNLPSPLYFPVQKDLLNRKVIKIESYIDADMLVSANPGGALTVRSRDAKNIFVTLMRENGKFKGGDFYKNIPLLNFRRQWDGVNDDCTCFDEFLIEPEYISWSDSYISIPNYATADPPGTILTVPFRVHWLFDDQDARPYEGIHKLR